MKEIPTKNLAFKRRVTKGLKQREQWKPFAIGFSQDDLRLNLTKTTIQRENIWIPYYEIRFEEATMKERMMEKKRIAADDNQVYNQDITDLTAQLKHHEENKEAIMNSDDPMNNPNKKMTIQERLNQKRLLDDTVGEVPIIDPKSIKLFGVSNDLSEEDITELMLPFGTVVRCRIPMDLREDPRFKNAKPRNKNIAFVTFELASSATAALEQGTVSFDVYNMDVEQAYDKRTSRPREFNIEFDALRKRK